MASLPILVYSAAQKGQAAGIVGASLFAGTAIVLYLISTLYHALPMGRAKAWFNRLDHAAIYLFIAGSYMPFLFGVLRGPWGWTLFGLVWAMKRGQRENGVKKGKRSPQNPGLRV